MSMLKCMLGLCYILYSCGGRLGRNDFINLRMGGYHATCVFLGVIGKRVDDVGSKQVMIETGIPGEDAPQKVLQGKHYNGMRAHLRSRGNDQSEAGCLPTIATFS